MKGVKIMSSNSNKKEKTIADAKESLTNIIKHTNLTISFLEGFIFFHEDSQDVVSKHLFMLHEIRRECQEVLQIYLNQEWI